MQSLREKLSSVLGWFGSLLWFLATTIFIAFPLYFLPIPWWVFFILLAVIMFTDALGGIVCLAAWIWAFIIVVSGPIRWLEIVFFVLFAVYLAVCFVPTIFKVIMQIHHDRR